MNFHHFIKHAGMLKTVKRTGWLRYLPAEVVESVSDHSCRAAMISLLLIENPNLNVSRCIKMALIHDLAESIVGDFTPSCKISKEEKYVKELEAMKEITKELSTSL